MSTILYNNILLFFLFLWIYMHYSFYYSVSVQFVLFQ